jgi:hypothetical protein
MDRQDAEAIPWMARYSRNPFPKRVAWVQDDVTHDRFYWLAVPPDQIKSGAQVIAELDGQRITITTRDVDRLLIRLNDRMLDLDKPVTVLWAGKEVFTGQIPRTTATLSKTLDERGDRVLMFSAEVEVRNRAN